MTDKPRNEPSTVTRRYTAYFSETAHRSQGEWGDRGNVGKEIWLGNSEQPRGNKQPETCLSSILHEADYHQDAMLRQQNSVKNTYVANLRWHQAAWPRTSAPTLLWSICQKLQLLWLLCLWFSGGPADHLSRAETNSTASASLSSITSPLQREFSAGSILWPRYMYSITGLTTYSGCTQSFQSIPPEIAM